MTTVERLALRFCTLCCAAAVIGGYVVTVDVIFPAIAKVQTVVNRLDKVEKVLSRIPFRATDDAERPVE